MATFGWWLPSENIFSSYIWIKLFLRSESGLVTFLVFVNCNCIGSLTSHLEWKKHYFLAGTDSAYPLSITIFSFPKPFILILKKAFRIFRICTTRLDPYKALVNYRQSPTLCIIANLFYWFWWLSKELVNFLEKLVFSGSITRLPKIDE